MRVEFGEWLPDYQDYENPGATIAKNVIPAAQSYLQFEGLSAFSDAMNAYARGAITVRDVDGNVYSYAGTGTKLYELAATVGDVSRLVGGDYTTDAIDGWEFVQWDNQVIGTNYADAVQNITIGGANFAALSGSPPRARHIAVVKDFVVLGNLNDGNALPNRLHWSAFDDETGWTAGTNQSDFQDLKGSGGWIKRVFGGEYGTIFQEFAIWRMTFVGGDAIFAFDKVEPERGLIASKAAAQFGRMIFYLGQDGFYMLADGVESIPIGHEKVNRYFFADIDNSNLHRICSAVDPTRNIVLWAYPGAGNSGGTPNKILIYNWVVKKWSFVELDVEFIFSSATFGFTLEDLDAFGTLETLPYSLDSRAWTGGNVLMGGFDTSHQLSYFNGSALTAVLETKELGTTGRNQVTMVRPIVHGNSATTTVQVGHRNTLNSSFSYSTTVTLNTTGIANVRKNARYHRIRCNIAGGFDHASGVEVEFNNRGRR